MGFGSMVYDEEKVDGEYPPLFPQEHSHEESFSRRVWEGGVETV